MFDYYFKRKHAITRRRVDTICSLITSIHSAASKFGCTNSLISATIKELKYQTT